MISRFQLVLLRAACLVRGHQLQMEGVSPSGRYTHIWCDYCGQILKWPTGPTNRLPVRKP